jgi:hypothetical protein
MKKQTCKIKSPRDAGFFYCLCIEISAGKASFSRFMITYARDRYPVVG